MDISNISFHCINEASDNEADAELNADYYRRTVRVNDSGKWEESSWTRFDLEPKDKIFGYSIEKRVLHVKV